MFQQYTAGKLELLFVPGALCGLRESDEFVYDFPVLLAEDNLPHNPLAERRSNVGHLLLGEWLAFLLAAFHDQAKYWLTCGGIPHDVFAQYRALFLCRRLRRHMGTCIPRAQRTWTQQTYYQNSSREQPAQYFLPYFFHFLPPFVLASLYL
jgi:hypothetical protein